MTEHAAADWRHKASCRNDPEPDNWFASAPNNRRALDAKAVCLRCPVRRDCGDEAIGLETRGGIVAAFHTAFEDEWEALRKFVGGESTTPTRTRKNARRTTTCAECGNAFVTKRPGPRCPQCVQGLTPAGPSRKRLRELHGLGMTWPQLGELLEMRPNSVQTIANDFKRPYVMRDTEAKIFAIVPTATAVKVA